MALRCPKCHYDNPSDTLYCGKCATPLEPAKMEEPSSVPSQAPSQGPSQAPSSAPDALSYAETMQTPVKELSTGSVFAGRYQVIELLGKGGMGKVYRVLDTKLKEEVALKLIKPEISSDREVIERFSNELKLTRRISHRNVGRMYELMEEAGTHFITMEYVPGENLKSTIRRVRQLSVGKSIAIAKQVCEGLEEAHRLGVVHRDLKPNNIILDDEGNARIMDFGIARSLATRGLTDAGVMIGTPEYMSPEQVEGKEADRRSDIYSLGIVLYEMLTGRLPFEGETALSVALKQKSEKPGDPRALNPEIPEELGRLILRCLEKPKEKRYQSAAEVRETLDRIEADLPTTARETIRRKPPLTSKEITVKFTLRKLVLPAAIAAAVLVIGLAAWIFWPAKSTVAGPKIANSIAVVGFENQTGDPAYDYLQKAIPSLLITSLEQAGKLYVVTWERLQDLLKQMDKPDVELIDRDLGFELCRREGVEKIVLGSFVKAGGMFATDVKVLDVETKKLLKSTASRGEGVDSILRTQIDELSRAVLRSALAAADVTTSELTPIMNVTTSSLDAYREYIKGEELTQKYYEEEAIPYFKKAIEKDPEFASAYAYMGFAYLNVGNVRAAGEALNKALALVHKVGEKERLVIRSFHAGWIENNLEKARILMQEAVDKFPREKMLLYWLAVGDRNRALYDEALNALERVLELDPNFATAHNEIAYVHMAKLDFPKAIEHFTIYKNLSPGEPNPPDSLGDALLLTGRLNEAIAEYKEAVRIKPDFYMTYSKIAYSSAAKEDYAEALKWVNAVLSSSALPGFRMGGYFWLGFYQSWLGQYIQALPSLKKAAELSRELGDEANEAEIASLVAYIYALQGHPDQAIKTNADCFATLSRVYPQGKPRYQIMADYFAGMIQLGRGRKDLAESTLEEMRALLPQVPERRKENALRIVSTFEGEILLSRGLPQQALSYFKYPSFSSGPPIPQMVTEMIWLNLFRLLDGKARAFQKMGDLDAAIAEYEALAVFNAKDHVWRLVHPTVHYYLGKLYEQKGLKDKAAERYRRFLELWKDADPGLPEVEDARARLGTLAK